MKKKKEINPEYSMGLPCSSDGKESACNAGDLGLIPRSGRFPGEGNGNLLQYSSLEYSPSGQRSLVGYSPWVRKESDKTERLTHTFIARTDEEAGTPILRPPNSKSQFIGKD